MKRIFVSVSLLLILVLVATCSSPTETINNNVSLSVDVSCTEAWLNLSVNNVSLPKGIRITKDGKDFISFTLTTKDTTLYDSTLTPNRSYTYQATINHPIGGQSDKVVATTLDTTSSNYNWQTFTFGDAGAGSSTLNDVAIINDTLAYAVGTIYLNDKNGNPDPQPYCLAKWNGKTWSLKKLYYKDKDYQGNEFTSVLSSIRGIFAFNSTDIWLAAGSVFHWNGRDSMTEFSYHLITPSGLLPGINKLWGTSSSNLYGVGNSGSIVHYTSGVWQKIESGTSLNFYGLFGNFLNQSNQFEILAVGADVGTAKGSVIVKITNQNTTSISAQNITGNITTTWFIPNRAYYMGSGLLYYKHKLTDFSWHYLLSVTQHAVTSIYGDDINEVFITSSGGEIVHFNGVSFKSYYNQVGMPQIVFGSIKSKGNLVITVGFTGACAVIAVGKK